MRNKGVMALVMSLLVLAALVWNPPTTTIEKKGGGISSEVATVFNFSRTRIKPASATESFTNSVTLTGGMPVTERSNPHPGGYLSIGILEKIIKTLQDLLNRFLAFLGSSLSLSINQSNMKEGSASPQYLGTLVIFLAATLIVISHFFAARKSGRAVTHVTRKKVVRELNKSLKVSVDPVIDAINALASEASKDLKKPSEAVTHRECSIVAQKVSKEEIKEEIMELIRDYEMIKFAGKKYINEDIRSIALKVINAIKGA